MVNKICNFLMKKIKEASPDLDKEREEVIYFGLQLLIGEIPKIFLLIAIAFVLGIGWLTILAFVLILPYKYASGGFHLKTHIGCIIGTTLFYCGIVFISKNVVFTNINLKYIFIILDWIFGMAMCTKYAPADTENIPILSKKERKLKKILSYIFLTISLIAAVIIPNNTISNILIFGMLVQSIFITRFAYKLTNSKYGYEVYKVD